ncbi:hypothetical protein ACRYI5_07875 [Furfurilactobacillus sp. WILCCON 0119]
MMKTTTEAKFMTRIINVMGVPFTLKMGTLTIETDAHLTFDQTVKNVAHYLHHIEKITTIPQDATPLERQRGLAKTELTPLLHQFDFINHVAQSSLDQSTLMTILTRQWAIRQAFIKYLQPLLQLPSVFAVALECPGTIQVGTAADTTFTWTIGVETPHRANTAYQLQNGAVVTQSANLATDNNTSNLLQATIVASDLAEASTWATIAVGTAIPSFLRIAVTHRLSGFLISSPTAGQSLDRGTVQQHDLVAV